LPSTKYSNERAWFKKWIIEGYSVRQLSSFCSHSPNKLRSIIHFNLDTSPQSAFNLSHIKYLVFDGTYLFRRTGIVALMNARTHSVIDGQYGVSESSPQHLHRFFNPIKERGLNPRSFTVDGNQSVIRCLKKIWPHITIQRCIVHIQRQGLSWCREKPKRYDAHKLRNIFLMLSFIKSHSDKQIFLDHFANWEDHYGSKIAISPERGWVFSDLKRARSMLIKAIPNMFHYLDDPFVPSSTNMIEGYFSRLKQHYRQHRGLSPNNRSNYFSWYFFFRPK